MNYKKNYYDYINYAKTLNRHKGDGNYYENHHIIPRSLGGDDSNDNMVLLTAREHFLAHYLLWKFNPCKETAFAFHTMSFMKNNKQHRNVRIISSRCYQELKMQYSKYISERRKGKPTMLGKHHSEETKMKISNAHKGKKLSEEHKRKDRLSNLGRKHSEETKKKISESNKGKHNMSEEYKSRLRVMNLGRHPSEETRRKMSMSGKGRVFSNEHKLHLSEAAKKRKYSEETRKRMSEIRKEKHIVTRGSTGMHWYNNGIINITDFECPEGFVPGRLPYKYKTIREPISEEHKVRLRQMAKNRKGVHLSEEQKNKISLSSKGKKWFNNGKISVMRFECPEGFVPGRIKKKN